MSRLRLTPRMVRKHPPPPLSIAISRMCRMAMTGKIGRRAKKAGVPITFYAVKGGGHGGWKAPKVNELTRDFLR